MDPQPRLEFASLDERSLEEILNPPKSPLGPEKGHRQLAALEKHVKSLGCHTVAIEWHYIDRDYIDDYSAFYAKGLFSEGNSCRRVHFFARSVEETIADLDQVLDKRMTGDQHANLDGSYLGFTVIKPLPGCPIGRTVVPPPVSAKGSASTYDFSPLCDDPVRLRGLELTVRGLAFQQQDLGVSACATTALWTALHRVAEFESFSTPTPAQITALASQYLLSFGRSMPSEGLSIAQMCQAVQAMGLAPNLIRVENTEQTRGLIHAIHSSGMAPVVVLQRGHEHHAVTMVGLEFNSLPNRQISRRPQHVTEPADRIVGIFVHDDRSQPYRRGTLTDYAADGHHPRLTLEGSHDEWKLTHILIPAHAKIRLSFVALRDIAVRTAKAASDSLRLADGEAPDVAVESRIVRSKDYIKGLVRTPRVNRETIVTLATKIPLSRYIGVVHMTSDVMDPVDVLLDTTSTWRSVRAIAIVVPIETRDETSSGAAKIADSFLQCPVVF